MKYDVYWTSTAESTLDSILDMIQSKWGEASAKKFIKAVKKNIDLISENPHLFKASFPKNVGKCVISKQTSVFYEVSLNNNVYLLYFWDNRQDPIINVG